MPNLRVLRAYHLYDHATGTLAANRSLKGLTHLLFHSHAGVRHLVACPDLPRLAHLELSRNALTPRGVALLQGCGVPFTADSAYPPGDHHWLVEGDWE
jgi:hypothetical protein